VLCFSFDDQVGAAIVVVAGDLHAGPASLGYDVLYESGFGRVKGDGRWVVLARERAPPLARHRSNV
jgi:hypothetical protein